MGTWTATGGVDVKGKGLMETYLWRPSEAFLRRAFHEPGAVPLLSNRLSKKPKSSDSDSEAPLINV